MAYRGRGRGGGGGGGRVCDFFLRGDCKFGDSCRNVHPLGQEGAQRQDRNSFAALSNQGQSNRGGRQPSGASGPQHDKVNNYGVTAEDIQADLTNEKPIWPFSCYGPGRNAPTELINSEREESPEEMRLKHYINANQAQEHANQLLQQIEGQRSAILNNIPRATQFILDAGNSQDPSVNRLLSAKQRADTNWVEPQPNQRTDYRWSTGNNAPQPKPFGAAPPPQSGGSQAPFGQASQGSFGAPSQLGGASSAKPAFGQPSFGAPSQLGGGAAPSQPAFGQPSTPAFGGPSQLGSNPAPQTAFGQPSGLGSGLGRPSPFAQQPQNQQQTGAPSQGNAFGSGGTFGAPSGPATGFGGFAQKPDPFASQSQAPTPSPFSQPQQQPAPSAFGTGSFGAPSQAQQQPSGFGANNQPQQVNGGGFGGSGFGGQQQTAPLDGLSAPSAATLQLPQILKGGPDTGPSQPAYNTYAQKTGNTLSAWKGQRVYYVDVTPSDLPPSDDPKVRVTQKVKQVPMYQRPNNGTEQRIWFPNGPEGMLGGAGEKSKLQQDAEASDDTYVGDLGKVLEEVYASARTTRAFKDGVMPEVPPKLDWVRYDI